MTTRDSTVRFSDRADNYNLYRPGYPGAIVAYLQQTIGLGSNTIIADIGSGTGIFSAVFLKAGYPVKAIEPNAAMRSIAEKNLQQYKGFQNINGTAEHTSLPDRSVDLITVAQAFHWFDLEKVKKEFIRILKPGGYVLLAWNVLQPNSPFMKAYTALKKSYEEKNAHPDQANPDNIKSFFEPFPVTIHTLKNIQPRDAEGLNGLLSSSSKLPMPGDERYTKMINEVNDLAAQYEENGMLELQYETKLFLAQMNEESQK